MTKTLAQLPRLICGWCHTTLRDGVEPVSHGICAGCASKLRDEETRPAWKESLDRVARAQARLWHDTPPKLRNLYLAEVDAAAAAEFKTPQQADGFRETDFDGRTAEEHEEP